MQPGTARPSRPMRDQSRADQLSAWLQSETSAPSFFFSPSLARSASLFLPFWPTVKGPICPRRRLSQI